MLNECINTCCEVPLSEALLTLLFSFVLLGSVTYFGVKFVNKLLNDIH